MEEEEEEDMEDQEVTHRFGTCFLGRHIRKKQRPCALAFLSSSLKAGCHFLLVFVDPLYQISVVAPAKAVTRSSNLGELLWRPLGVARCDRNDVESCHQ